MNQARQTGSTGSVPNSVDAPRSPVLRLVDLAARRRTLTLALQHSAMTLLGVLTGAILLLLLGTDLLAWPWLASLVFGGFALTAIRFRRDLVGRYSVAQMVDSRLRLGDSLSTAWYLLSHPGASTSSLASAQIARAEQSAVKIQPATAFPLVWQRRWTAVGALAAVAFGLFATRYLVTSTLSLKPSLIPLHAFFSGQEMAAARHDIHSLGGDAAGPANQPARRMPTPAARGKEDRSAAQQQGTQPAGSKASGLLPEKQNSANHSSPAGKSSRDAESQTAAQASDRQTGVQAAKGKSREGEQRADSTSREAQPDGSPTPSTSLAERMKEALSGLLDKMRPRSGSPSNGPGERPQQSPDSANANPATRPQNEPNDRNSKSSQEQAQGRSQSAPAQAPAQASEKMPGTASHASDESAGKKGNDAHSGIGRQDGEKALREAEQLRAMGKLEEIIGKRSASLTGAMTVETQSGKQQLRTQYTGRLGSHADLGGEIDRSEVPLALQNYVREYMEQVRKQSNGNQ